MVNTKRDLKEFLRSEKKVYYKDRNIKKILFAKITNEYLMEIWKYQKSLRIAEYYLNNRNKFINWLKYAYWVRKNNRLGQKLGIHIPLNVFDKGLIIDHYGSIIINGDCKIGKNCRLHGNNCIGNKGVGREEEYPCIGDNCDVGVRCLYYWKCNIRKQY